MDQAISTDLRVRIVNRILFLSQFSYHHEGWWTLQDLMGDPPWEEEDADHDTTIVELYDLIKDDDLATHALRVQYQAMTRRKGELG